MPLAVPASFDTPDVAQQTLALGQPEDFALTWTGLGPHAPVAVETLDHRHGHARAVWESLGEPAHPTREQTQTLRQGAAATRAETFYADVGGTFVFQRAVEPWSVLLITQR